MADDLTQFQSRLFGTFLREAAGHVGAMPGLLAILEQNPGQAEAARDLFREIHSLKGAAGAAEQEVVEFLCQSLEQILIKIQRGDLVIGAGFFVVFYHGHALLEEGLAGLARGCKFTIPLQFLESVRKLM